VLGVGGGAAGCGIRNLWCEEGRGNTTNEVQYLADAAYMRAKFVKLFVTTSARWKSSAPA